MSLYRKKPIVIHAIHFTGTGDSCDDVLAFVAPQTIPPQVTWKGCTNDGGFIETLEGKMEFKPGDYIIRGIKGELYPCRSDIFEASYEPVTAERP